MGPQWQHIENGYPRDVGGRVHGAVGGAFVATGQSVRMLFPLMLASVSLAGWALVARGQPSAAIRCMVYGYWTATTVTVIFTGGLSAPLMVVYPGLIVLVGLLTHWRQTLLIGVMTVGVILALAWAESGQFLPQALPRAAFKQAVDQSVVNLVFMAIGLALARAFQVRLKALHALSDDLSRRSAALEVTQAELHRAQSVATVGSWVGDISTDTMRVSDEMMRIFGLAQGSRMSYSSYKGFVHPDDRVALDLAWRAALKGAPFDEEHRILVNGSVHWIRQKAAMVVLRARPGPAGRRDCAGTSPTAKKQSAHSWTARRAIALWWSYAQPVLVHRDGVLVYVNEARLSCLARRTRHLCYKNRRRI